MDDECDMIDDIDEENEANKGYQCKIMEINNGASRFLTLEKKNYIT